MIVRRLEALFSFRFDPAQLDRANGDINKFAENANNAMTALAGHFVVQSIKNFVDSTTQAMADVGRMAGMLGISTQALEELRYAAEKSGVAIDTLDDSMKELQIRAVDAKAGEGEAAEAFKKIGVKTTNAAGKIREPLELLSEVADKLKKLPNQSERLWVADAMFGDQGAEMLKILEGGSKGLAQMRHEARDLGYILDDGSVESAKKFREGINTLKAAFSAIVRNVTKSLLPAMTAFAERSTVMWTSLSATFANLNENTTILRAAFTAIGIVLAGLAIKAVIAFAPFLAIGVLIAGVALIIDDLWTAFSGGESVSKKIFEVILGWFQAYKTWVFNFWRTIWNFLPQSLQENLKLAWDLIRNFAEVFDAIIMTICKRAWGFISETVLMVTADIKNAIIQVFEVLSKIFSTVGPLLARSLVDAIDHAVTAIKEAILGIKSFIDNVVPDFVKKGFSAAVEYVGGIGSQYDQPSQKHLAPQPAYSSNNIQNHSNQNVNVAVNVKTGAEAHEIGSEISKALRKELEKEKINAFMGIKKLSKNSLY
jgi:TP901 family phage tail tape measure protein